MDWALWIGAGVAACGALSLFLWALFWDRSRGRKRCPRCWYPMDTVVAAGGRRCPECGHEAADERRLLRTRRKWRWTLAAAMLGVMAYGLGITPRVMKKGWASAIPSTVLVSVWPGLPGEWVAAHLDGQVVNDAAADELDTRLKDGTLAHWQASMFRSRVEARLRREKRFGVSDEQKVLEKLAAARVTLRLDAQRLQDVLDFYQTKLGVPIKADWEALAEEKLTPDTLLSISLTSATGLDALDGLLPALDTSVLSPVEWRVEEGEVVLGKQNPGNAVPVCSHDFARSVIRDEPTWAATPNNLGTVRIAMGNRLEALQRIVTSSIDPEGWVDAGGAFSTISMIDSHAIVVAPARTQWRIDALLAGIDRIWPNGRAASADPEEEWDEVAAVHAKLAATSVILPGGFMSVRELTELLASAIALPVVVDWGSLASVHVMPDLPVKIDSEKLSVIEVMARYFPQLTTDALEGVSWTIHAGALRIGARYSMDARMVLRVYNATDLLPPIPESFEDSDDDGRALNTCLKDGPGRRIEDSCWDIANLVMRSIEADGWVANGGESGWITPLGPLLIVRTNARNHFAIDDLLAKLRAAKARGEPIIPSDDGGANGS